MSSSIRWPASRNSVQSLGSRVSSSLFIHRPFKFALAEYFRDFHLVVLVPAFTSGVLCRYMTRIVAPFFQRLTIFPPNDRKPFTVFGSKTLYRDETRSGLYIALQRIRGLRVVHAGRRHQ